MSTKTRLGAIAIAVGAAISGGASAADNTFYIGGAWGGEHQVEVAGRGGGAVAQRGRGRRGAALPRHAGVAGVADTGFP